MSLSYARGLSIFLLCTIISASIRLIFGIPAMKPLATFLSSLHPEMPAITWHLLSNRIAQRNKTSCSAASLTIALNGYISARDDGVVDNPLTECKLLDMLPESDLRSNLSEGKGGATLAQINEMAAQAVEALGLSDLSVNATFFDENSVEPQTEAFKRDLEDASKDCTTILIANFHQGVVHNNELAHGHFSPVSPLAEDAGKVCVVDPAMEGFPFVIDFEHLVRAMSTRDKSAGRNRGYLKIACKTK